MQAPLLELRDVSKRYRTLGSWWREDWHRCTPCGTSVSACMPAMSMDWWASGSGKSTLARLALALEWPDDGSVNINGADVGRLRPRALRALRREVQIVFQDPYGALNPLLTVADAVAEPLTNFKVGTPAERKTQVAVLLRDVGLPARLIDAYPHQLSGGERQRCVSRAPSRCVPSCWCATNWFPPDKSIQAQILNLLRDLQQEYGLAYLFISHDLAVVNHLCTRVAVMLRGRIVEDGERLQVLQHSAHPYTRSLTAAAAYFVEGSDFPELTPAAATLPTVGCVFQDRCPLVQTRCRRKRRCCGNRPRTPGRLSLPSVTSMGRPAESGPN